MDSVPWDRSDLPDSAFRKLVDSVWSESQRGTPNPQLEQIFDYYLRMVWLQMGLAIPARYVDGHPFDLPFGDSIYAYELPEDLRTPPREIRLEEGQSVREALGLAGGATEGSDFRVIVDDLELQRPLRFRSLPTTTHQVKKPILFVGRCREEFPGIPKELSSGPLEFDAYLFWAPKIVPTEHQGVLIRVHGSSGTLFDPTFMRYQVSEQTRLRQTTCEIFVRSGLEGALNIDRESFNYAHPHVVYLTKWLHVALRRLATVQKAIAADIRRKSRQRGEREVQAQLDRIVTTAWQRQADDEGQAPPTVTFIDPAGGGAGEGAGGKRAGGGYRFQRSTVFGTSTAAGGGDRRSRAVERKLEAVIQLLAAYELLDSLSTSDQEQLASYLREILQADDE